MFNIIYDKGSFYNVTFIHYESLFNVNIKIICNNNYYSSCDLNVLLYYSLIEKDIIILFIEKDIDASAKDQLIHK